MHLHEHLILYLQFYCQSTARVPLYVGLPLPHTRLNWTNYYSRYSAVFVLLTYSHILFVIVDK